ncbi:hypothetical protein HDV05_002402 [Chytridiales sp. JEL 0842]|nr:hypothetical protein HDV05_002402 [Chytridiales sp. JEL 0842]
MNITSFVQQEVHAEAKSYFERKHIDQIMESIVTGLIYTQPDDPLSFIEDCCQRIRKGDLLAGKPRVQWDYFLPVSVKEATIKREKNHKKALGKDKAEKDAAAASKKLQPIEKVPLLPPVKNAFIMPDVHSKPLLSKSGKGSAQGSGFNYETPLPALPPKMDLAGPAEPLGGVRSSTARGHSAGPLNHPNIVFVLGGPGSGKGTQCARLAKEFQLTHLSTGDLLRAEVENGTEVGIRCAEMMKEGKIVPMNIILGLLRDAIASNISTPGFLIDGFPRAMDQALEFQSTISTPRLVLYFTCPLTVLESRLLERGKTSGRADDNLDTIRKRFSTFENQSLPVVEHFKKEGKVVEIASTKPVEEVYEETRIHFLDLVEGGRKKSPLPPITPAQKEEEVVRELERGVTAGASKPVTATAEPSLASKPATAKPVESAVASKPVTAAPIVKKSGGAWDNIVFVLGGPGCGKGTQCVRLAQEFNYTHLSAGDLLRAEVASGSARAQELDALMKEGKIVPMEITLSLLREAMEKSPSASGFLIDGFPRQLDQASAFENTIADPKLVLFFDCPEETLEKRLLKRGETSGRADDNLETIKKRFRTFVETSLPVVEYFEAKGKCVRISSVPGPDEVYENVKQHFVTKDSSDVVLAETTAATDAPALPALDLTPLTHPNILFVLGGPGSGKGTQCTRLAKKHNLTHLSTGDLLRAELESGSEIGKACGDLMKEGKIVPMEIILGLLHQAIAKDLSVPGFLIDGFPRAMDQALEFESSICKARKVLFFNCPLETLQERLIERGKTSGRADDNLDTILKRFKTFEEQSLPVVEYFEKEGRVIRMDATEGVEEVYKALEEKLGAEGIISLSEEHVAASTASEDNSNAEPVTVPAENQHAPATESTTDQSQSNAEPDTVPAENQHAPATESTTDQSQSNAEPDTVPAENQHAPATESTTDQSQPTLRFDDSANIVFVLGGPGSGKGTQCAHLVSNLGYAHLSTGDLLREEVKKGTELGERLEALMKEGKMVPLEVTLELLVNAMEEKRGAPGYLIDGFPRTMEQAAEFEAKIGKCKFVLFFDASTETLTQRLLKRGETSGRADDNLESITKRLETFKEASMPVIEHFEKDGRVRKVLAEGDVEEITKYNGVELTALGKKNYLKLADPATKKIREPPAKKCKGCEEKMDWRRTGQLQKRANGYTYQQFCKGCRKTKWNDEKLEQHKQILKAAEELSDDEERKSLLMTSPVYSGNQKKMQEHRAIQNKAAEVADPEEREALMLTSSVYVGNKKKYATPESIAKHNADNHRYRAKSILEQESVTVIQAHCRSMQDHGIKSIIRGRLAGVDLRGDLVYFDTESKSRSHTHADTTLWAFFRVTQGFLSVSRSTTGKYWVWLEGKKSLLASPDALGAISRFVGTARVVYFASSNSIDMNRLEDWYKLEQRVVPFRWLNAGFDVLFKVFGRKGQPILSPNCELQTVYANLWQLGGRGDIYYTNHTHKAALFPQVPWSLANSETGKVWVDCLMLFDIVECVRCLVNCE